MLGQRSDGKLLLDFENGALLSQIYRTREQARTDVFDYIERFYNPFRKHSKLNYLSPVQFEEQQRSEG